MDFGTFVELLDRQLEEEPRLRDLQRAHSDVAGVWTRAEYRADVTPAGSTGIDLRVSTHGRTLHERTFASSPVSVPRIARAIAEHLTGYAN